MNGMLLYHGNNMETVKKIKIPEGISSVIAIITPGILRLLMENRKLDLREAAELLYNSQLYKDLENESLKIWRLSYFLLYDLLEEELATGRITYPEEQI